MRTTRRVVQASFLALTLFGVFVYGGNAERWCPFGGVEAIYTYVSEGNMLCSLGVSNFYILGGVLAITLLLRRAFCGYMCPIGTMSEWLQRGADRMGRAALAIPHRIDNWLGMLKYPVLAIVLFFTYRTAELVLRGFDPCYVLLSRHGEDIKIWAYLIAGAIVLGSIFIVMPFCRWLCPLAAVLSPFSRFGLTRIGRDEDACIGCGECANVCPMNIPVDDVPEVTHARCLSCLNCVEECRENQTDAMRWGPPKWMGGRSWPAAAVVAIILFCTTAAVATSYLLPIPSFVKSRGESPAVTATCEFGVHDLTCRGRANLLVYYLERDDMYEIPGYVKLEAWPGPGTAKAQVTYDPAQCDEAAVKQAVTEPYFDALAEIWRPSPFRIEGYDPLELDE